MTVGRIIETDADVAEGAAALAAMHPRFAHALALTGPLPLRRRAGGFEALLSAIVSQQISVAAAKGIWARLEAQGATTEAGFSRLDAEGHRACGLSRQKIRYATALAEAGVPFDDLPGMPDDDVIARLTAVTGIGVWTAEIYAMFSLGRADVFAPGDLALQEAARMLFDLPERPKERAFRAMAADWAPWRAVAARLLWAYYHVKKDREGIR
ncbi:MAG: DNA-3-methyladenine glycosylase 2 family protein [Pseudomonadota bacterium]